jgi:heat shock protein HspQ
MSCPYGKEGCQNTDQCLLCFNGNKYVAPKKKQQGLQKNYNKKTKRMGAVSENITQQQNQATIDSVCSSRLTVNSGAGQEKGDAWITGLVEIAQEVKTQLPERAKGCKNFTISREWLEKLNRESKAANKEFWYLVFSFKEDDEQQYVVAETQVFQDMIANLVHDRKIAKEANKKIDLANKQRRVAETRNTELEAKVDRLQAELDYYKALLEGGDDISTNNS